MHKNLQRLVKVRLAAPRGTNQCLACLDNATLSRGIVTISRPAIQVPKNKTVSNRSTFPLPAYNIRLSTSILRRTFGTVTQDDSTEDIALVHDDVNAKISSTAYEVPPSLQTIDPMFFDLSIIPPEPIKEFRELYEQIAQSKDPKDHEKFLSVYRSIADDMDLLLQLQPIDFMLALNSCRDLLHMIPRMQQILVDLNKTSHKHIADIYNILLKAYVKMSDFKSCENMIDKMRAQGMELGSSTYHIILDLCKHRSRFRDAQGVLKQMRKNDIEVSSSTYLILLAICARCKQARQAQEYFDEMPLMGLEPEIAHYNALINAYAHAKDPQGAKKVYQLMEEDGITPDHYTYTAMIKALKSKGRTQEAIGMVSRLREQGGKPNAKVLAAIDLDSYDVVEDCIRNEVEMNRGDFNMLISRALRSNQFSQVPYLMEKMQKAGHRPDVFTFTAMIDADVKMGKYQEAKEIFEAMQQANIQPDVIAYSVMISGALSHVGVQESMSILKAMIDDGLLPNLHTFNSLLSASVGEIGVEGFRVIRQTMQDLHIRPDNRSFNALLSAYALQGDIEEMVATLEDMKNSHVAPDALTYSILISGYLQNGDLRYAMEWYYKMLDSRLVPSTYLLNNLMAALHGSGQGQQVMLLWSEMSRLNIGKNQQSFEIALEACEKFGLHDARSQIEGELNHFLSGSYKY
ncbi:hypothetical protein BGZ46_008547 [Entomortierella lignicola]|nr:hypothetical protein BGZ46_008547 [Entomortierella lignicola]